MTQKVGEMRADELRVGEMSNLTWVGGGLTLWMLLHDLSYCIVKHSWCIIVCWVSS